MKKRHYFIVLISVLTVLSVCSLIVAKAQADYWGRAAYHGYFSNVQYGSGYHQSGWPDNGYVLPPGALSNVNSVGGLISTLQSYYNQGDPWLSMVSFIVDTMLGRNGGVAKGVSSADWTNLSNRLNAVSIDWNNTRFSTSYNTYHMATDGTRKYSANDAGWATSGQGPSNAIVMSDPSNSQIIYYALFKSCANPVGGLPGLPPGPTTGAFDAANCSTISGWAFDPNNSNASVTIHAYYGGPSGSGAPGVAHSANIYRSDVNKVYGIGGDHGFSFANDYPNAAKATTIYIYSLSTSGGANSLIGTKAYGPCTHAATVTPSSSASPATWSNPSQAINFTHKLTTSNYGSINHSVSLTETCKFNGTSLCNGTSATVATKSVTVTGNGTQTVFTHSVSIPAGATQVCEQLVVSNGGGATVTGSPSSACVGVRAGSTKASATASPQFIQQGQSATLSGALITSGFRGDSYPVTCNYKLIKTSVSGSVTTVASNNCNQNITKSDAPNGTTFYTYNYNAGTDPIGTSICLTVNAAAGDFGGNSSDKDCAVVITAPYFTAIGGDVSAGTGYLNASGSCFKTAAKDAIIKSWSSDGYPYYGAATELAALALGKISNFASATTIYPTNPYGTSTAGLNNKLSSNLMFSNSSNPGNGNLGSMACMPDFYGIASPTATSLPTGSITTWPSGTYKVPDKWQLGTNGSYLSIPAGRRITIVADGDVYIAGKGIRYDTASSTKAIPRLTVIARGNIYIGNAITELHGAYIAQPKTNGTGGTVYTCAVIPTTGTPNVSNNYADCGNTQMTAYGAIAAQSLSLGRSVGSMTLGMPAEVFQFTPELWIGGGADVSNFGTSYDSVTSLPPTL